MKPLVYYCRWHGVSLRLRGRSETAVWGELVPKGAADKEQTQEFKFNLQSWELILKEDGQERVLQLDEMGTVIDQVSDSSK